MADNKFAYMDMPLQIGFQYAGPLDKYVQFATRAEADAWLTGALAYEGALVRVKETLTDNLWHVYKVDSVEGVLTFSSASELPLVDGKLSKEFIPYTVSTPTKDVFVLTNSEGYVDPALLNLSYTTVGGTEAAGKIVKVGENGQLDQTLIPSIAIGEDLGRFESWELAEAGVAHTPEHGDTIAIGTETDNDIYICLTPNADSFSGKFTILRPSSGAVTISDFNTHKNNEGTEKHVTAEQISAWDVKLDVADVVAGTNIEVVADDENKTVTINNTYTYTLEPATTTKLGGVKIGGALNIADDGTVSVNTTNLQTHFDERYYVVKEDEENKVLSTNDFTDDYKTSVDELNTWKEEFEIPVASATQAGVVKIGEGIDVDENGLISVNVKWTQSTFPALNAGEGEEANKYYEWNKVCEVKIFDENGGVVFPSEYIVKDGKTRIEFPADFPADGEDTTKWKVLVGPALV